MEYFLHVEDDLYHAWRAGLLIESFKANNLEDKLLISSASYEKIRSSGSHLAKNLLLHKRKISVPSIEKKECKELNRAYGLNLAVLGKYIKQPFCFLDIDSVLMSEPSIESDSNPGFTFYVDPNFTIDEAEKNVGDFLKWGGLDRASLENVWLPLGGFQIFQNFPNSFFSKTLDYADQLAVRQLVETRKVWEKTHELSLVLNLATLGAKAYGSHSMCSPMSAGGKTNFISYNYGHPPIFHNSMFKFESNISFGDPISILSEIKYSPNSKYISTIARRLIERRK